MSKKLSKKEYIIARTKELVKEQDNITIKDIADATGMNIAAVNYHFGSKENLLQQVIVEVLTGIKLDIANKLRSIVANKDIDSFTTEVLTILYDYILHNIGVFKYIFLSAETQMISSKELYNAFFFDKEFTDLVYKQLQETMSTNNPKKLTARYMVIFSSVVMPMLMQILQGKEDTIALFSDPEFKTFYIQDLLDMINKK